ncbi:MAG: ATP-dependent sacrificial sulfur transferase LarE [Acidobacteriota bacterium]
MSRVEELTQALRRNVAEHDSVLVAFSAGVDSTLVLAVATEVLGDRALGVTGVSPSVAPAEIASAKELAEALGARLRLASTNEMDDPSYVANPTNRCFHCKTELYSVCERVAREEGVTTILNGTNADDPGDHRPGLVAADNARVRSPLLECGLHKDDVRAVARHLGVPNWDKPALACLASRLPHGTPVTIERLRSVDSIEIALREMGFQQVRARHFGDEVRLEVESERVDELSDRLHEAVLQAAVSQAGFSHATVTPGGYRTGRLNELTGSV